MDPRLLMEAVAKNDENTFINLVRENEDFLDQRTAESMNTVLHWASRFGDTALVKEVLKLRPMFVDAENAKLETPLHEACRHGQTEVLKLLLEANPEAACKLNAENQSPFFVACSNGHLDVVKILLNQSWLVGLEDEGLDATCLHVAASRGFKDIVRELLNVCPGLAITFDKNGYSPLHYACNSGHLEITKMLLYLGLDIALQFSSTGYMPLHLAAMNGKTETFEEFERMAPICFHHLTRQGETVFHLTVKYKHYDAFMWLVGAFHDTDLFHRTDKLGNTLLHLAVSRGCSQMVAYLINETTPKINSENCEGLTALDILDQADRMDKFPDIKDLLERSGGRKGARMLSMTNEVDDPSNKRNSSEVNSIHHQVEETNEIQDDNTTKPEYSPRKTASHLSNASRHKRLSRRRREELAKFYNDRRYKRHDIYWEALQNARNTITLVSILIATVAFTAGMNPPPGIFSPEGKKENSTLKEKTAFKVFIISNNLALFTSLSIVIILVSIIPFQRKLLMRLLVIIHKVMWVAVSCMATSYFAATWMIVHRPGLEWMFEALIVICASTMGTLFLYLGHTLATHWLRKLKWRKDKGKKDGTVAPKPTSSDGKIQSTSANPNIRVDVRPNSSDADVKKERRSQSSFSTNSDISSSMSRGYHPY
ncbi:hypothetical protein F2P56_028046 [Juglans regia]|uniref:PGG domain-containing protein n=2 Tax=Juglans regia TaxID=51240 RepID=A0A833U9M3_JUGRE|nr:ankyrin repeat-containing protein At5g02620-like [Juglans regia]KAF5453108.1 hypothetical protein F2P56_028046 [Juglans regia]